MKPFLFNVEIPAVVFYIDEAEFNSSAHGSNIRKILEYF